MRRPLMAVRITSKWYIFLIICVVSGFIGNACEEWAQPYVLPEYNPDLAPSEETLGERPVERRALKALTVIHQELIPNILKAENTEICAYRLRTAPRGSYYACKTLEEWEEILAVQIVLLSWLYTISLSALYFTAGCLIVQSYLKLKKSYAAHSNGFRRKFLATFRRIPDE